MSHVVLQAVGARGAARRVASLSRELNAAVARLGDLLSADLIAVVELPIVADGERLGALHDLLAEATETGPVTVIVTRSNTATTAP